MTEGHRYVRYEFRWKYLGNSYRTVAFCSAWSSAAASGLLSRRRHRTRPPVVAATAALALISRQFSQSPPVSHPGASHPAIALHPRSSTRRHRICEESGGYVDEREALHERGRARKDRDDGHQQDHRVVLSEGALRRAQAGGDLPGLGRGRADHRDPLLRQGGPDLPAQGLREGGGRRRRAGLRPAALLDARGGQAHPQARRAHAARCSPRPGSSPSGSCCASCAARRCARSRRCSPGSRKPSRSWGPRPSADAENRRSRR